MLLVPIRIFSKKLIFSKINEPYALFMFLSKIRLVESVIKLYTTSQSNDFSVQINLIPKIIENQNYQKVNFLTGAKNYPKPCPNFRV